MLYPSNSFAPGVYYMHMISSALLILLGIVAALIVGLIALAAFIFLVVFKKGLNLPITTKDGPNNQPPS